MGEGRKGEIGGMEKEGREKCEWTGEVDGMIGSLGVTRLVVELWE